MSENNQWSQGSNGTGNVNGEGHGQWSGPSPEQQGYERQQRGNYQNNTYSGGGYYNGYTYDNSIEGYYARDNAFDGGIDGKSRGIAGLLAIFLGAFGVQYFYLGKVGGGLLCILLSLVTCGIWEIITLIQGIMMLCMNNYTFTQKYVLNRSTMPLF